MVTDKETGEVSEKFNPSKRSNLIECPMCGETLKQIQTVYRCKSCTDLWTYIGGKLYRWNFKKKEWYLWKYPIGIASESGYKPDMGAIE